MALTSASVQFYLPQFLASRVVSKIETAEEEGGGQKVNKKCIKDKTEAQKKRQIERSANRKCFNSDV